MSARPLLRIALVGFGHVGRRFAELLRGPYRRILRDAGVEPVLTGVATARHGIAIDEGGLDPRRAASLAGRGRSLAPLHHGRAVGDSLEFLRRVPADVLVELTPLDPRRGQPALDHVRAALRRGLHVVTANKGPLAFDLHGLRRLAAREGRLFLYEGAVMDGAPVFNLVERCLPGARVLGFRGVLNTTTTRILARLEQGASFERALRELQAAGIAEADPRHDVDGWDAVVKACALANALMGARLTPDRVRRRGIAGVDAARVRAARRSGKRWRLVARAVRIAGGVRVSVGPERLASGDLLASAGADGILVLETDRMGEIGVWQGESSVEQTGYAILSDLVWVAKDR
ncbi:MAG: homoserine dehydrogenase [Vicinamibacteria bacterium]